MVAIQRQHWRDASIERAEAITDAWEVTKVYAGRLAEWVLFLCMIANIIEILPGVSLSIVFSNSVLSVQAVTLDIAGFGLATMAAHAQTDGDEHSARKAKWTAWTLITIMLLTVLSVSIGSLWTEVAPYTMVADKILILVRVGMTVIYGHVLHSLRQHTVNVVPASVIEERLNLLTERLSHLRQEPLNYERLAAQIVPLFPQPESPNDEGLAAQIVAQVVAQMTVLHEQERAFHVASEKPRAAPGPFHLKAVKGQEEKSGDERQGFIREYLTDHPEASISTIVKAGQLKGITLSTGYVSQQRKLFQQEAS